MPINEEITPEGIADLNVHIRDTFAENILHAGVVKMGWGQIYEGKPYPHKSGANVSVPIVGALAVDTAELPDTGDPDPLASVEDESLIPCRRYGDFVLVTEGAVEEKDMFTLEGLSVALAEQAIKKGDLIAGTAAVAGSSVFFKNGRVNAAALEAGDVIDSSDFVRMFAALDDGESDTYMDGLYRAFLNTKAIASMYEDGTAAKGFLARVENTTRGEAVNIQADIGVFHGFRIFKVGQANTTLLGANGGDLIKSVFCGRKFMGYSEAYAPRFSGLQNGGGMLDTVFKMYWKARYGWGRMIEAQGIRLEHRSTFSTNP